MDNNRTTCLDVRVCSCVSVDSDSVSVRRPTSHKSLHVPHQKKTSLPHTRTNGYGLFDMMCAHVSKLIVPESAPTERTQRWARSHARPNLCYRICFRFVISRRFSSVLIELTSGRAGARRSQLTRSGASEKVRWRCVYLVIHEKSMYYSTDYGDV